MTLVPFGASGEAGSTSFFGGGAFGGGGGGFGGGHGGGGGGGGFAHMPEYLTTQQRRLIPGGVINANPKYQVPTNVAPSAATFGKPIDRGVMPWVDPTQRKMAHGGATGPGAIITGDPQEDGKPNPEVVISSAPMTVIPLKDISGSKNLPKFANGTGAVPSDGEVRMDSGGNPWRYNAQLGHGERIQVDPAQQPAPAQPQPVNQIPQGPQAPTPPQPVVGGRMFPTDVPKDPMEKVWEDPVILARQKANMAQFLSTAPGSLWLTNQQQAQAGAVAKHNTEVAKFNATQQTKEAQLNAQNQRAFESLQAANQRAAAGIEAAQKRQQSSMEHADRVKLDAEDMAYADAVGRLQNRWNAKQLTPEEMIRFDGLRTAKAIEAELKKIDEERKAGAEQKREFFKDPATGKHFVQGAHIASTEMKGTDTPMTAVEAARLLSDARKHRASVLADTSMTKEEQKAAIAEVDAEISHLRGMAYPSLGKQPGQPVDASSLTEETFKALPAGAPIRKPDGTIVYKK